MSCNFHVNDILHVPDRSWKDARFAARACKQYRLIHGHLHFEFFKALDDAAHIVTFLRDPVERVLSLYFFLRNQQPEAQSDSTARFAVAQARSLPLHRFVAHTDLLIAPMVSDFQVQMLLSDAQTDRPPETWLQAALANLRRYRFIGIADPDLIDDSMLAMTRAFGWMETKHSPRVNHTARRAQKPELARAREIIRARNAVDLALYERVRAEFLERRAAKRRRPSHSPKKALQMERARYASGLTGRVTMDQPLRGWGWHDRESDSKGCWRCAAQSRVGLELRPPPAPTVILLFGLHSIHPRIAPRSMTIEVHGRRLPTFTIVENNRRLVWTVIEREHVEADGLLSLEIVCQELPDPAIVEETRDDRYVTFGLQSIDLLIQEVMAPGAFALVSQAIRSSAELAQRLQDAVRELESESTARAREQRGAAEFQAGLLERAKRAETYSESLRAELDKHKREYASVAAESQRTRGEAERCQAGLLERAQLAETYSESLRGELDKRTREYAGVVAESQHTRGEAERCQAALLERAQRAETYSESLRAELDKHKREYGELVAERQRAQAEADRYHAALLERAQRAETYNAALSAELRKQERDSRPQLQVDPDARVESAGRPHAAERT